MFFGTKERRIDKKGRVSFSKNLLQQLGEKPIISLNEEEGICLYPEAFRERFEYSQMWEARVDRFNRILIPRHLINSLPLLKRSIIIVGEGDHLVIRPRKGGFYSRSRRNFRRDW